jgi:hypothetical protein
MAALAEWDSFYVIMGAAAGTLIGLQFVVMTLIAGGPNLPGPETASAFGAPTIVHFGAVLFLAAALRMPWPSVTSVMLLLGLAGVGGAIYSLIVGRRMRLQTGYSPDLEDWWFHFLLPLAAYALILAASFALMSHSRAALFGVGIAEMLLLFVGLHNAWDSVAYQVFVKRRRDG